MEQDQRLTPLPRSVEMQSAPADYPPGYSGYYDDESLANKRSIRQYLNVIQKRLTMIVAIAIVVTAAAALYSFRQPSVYQAQAQMIIEPRKPPVTQKDAININFGGDTDYYNTQLQLLQSPELMKKVVVSLGLHRDARALGEESKGIFGSLKGIFSSDEKKAASDALPILSDNAADTNTGDVQLTPEEEALAGKYVGMLAGSLKVERVENTNLVNISVTNPNPELAARVADKIGEIFIKEDGDREIQGAQKVYDELGKSIEELKGTIAKQETEQIEQMRSSGLPLQDKGGDLRAANLGTLQAQFNEAAGRNREIAGTLRRRRRGQPKGRHSLGRRRLQGSPGCTQPEPQAPGGFRKTDRGHRPQDQRRQRETRRPPRQVHAGIPRRKDG